MRTKKTILVTLQALLLIIMSILSSCGQKYDDESDFRVSIINDGKAVMITRYVGNKQTVRIPAKINGLPVTRIADEAFEEKNLYNVIIPNGVLTIGEGAFWGNKLSSVTIPNSVTSLGDAAFYDNDLTSVIIPNNIGRIGIMAFYENPLTQITIGADVDLVGEMYLRPAGWDEKGFYQFYVDNNKQAGSYVYQDQVWIKR